MASYGSTAGVEALVPALGTLGAGTPTSDEVTAWLEDGYAIINRYIGGSGYVVPVTSSEDLYEELRGLNNLYAAAQAMRARKIDTTSGEEENRAEIWLRDFWQQLRDMIAMDLTAAGLTATTTTTARRRRIRTLQLRRVDGYSGAHEGEPEQYDATSE